MLADVLKLTDDDRAQRLSSGNQGVAENRVYWAGTYLRKAGLLTSPARGTVAIPDEGRRVLSTNPSRIDRIFLSQLPVVSGVHQRSSRLRSTPERGTSAATVPADSEVSPEERIESGVAGDQERTRSGPARDRQEGLASLFREGGRRCSARNGIWRITN